MSTFRSRPPRPMRWFAALAAAVVGARALRRAHRHAPARPAATPLQIRQVDTTDPGRSTMQFLYTGDPADVRGALGHRQRQRGRRRRARRCLGARRGKIAVALVFDTSDAMDSSGALVAAKEAAGRWIQGRTEAEQANQLVGVYTVERHARPGPEPHQRHRPHPRRHRPGRAPGRRRRERRVGDVGRHRASPATTSPTRTATRPTS